MIKLNQEAMLRTNTKEVNYIDHSNKYIWCCIQKNASSSIRATLTDLDLTKVYLRHILLEYNDYFKFAFVRNPWSRLASCYQNRIIENFANTYGAESGNAQEYSRMGLYSDLSFDKFVEIVAEQDDENSDRHWRSQTSFFVIDGVNTLDFIEKLETITRDWKRLSPLIHTTRPLKHLKRSNKKQDYKDYYNKRTKDIVAKRYEQDIDLLKYTF